MPRHSTGHYVAIRSPEWVAFGLRLIIVFGVFSVLGITAANYIGSRVLVGLLTVLFGAPA